MIRINNYRNKIIFITDLFFIILSCFICYILIPVVIGMKGIQLFIPHIITLLLCVSLCQYLLKTYVNIWRYAGYNGYVKIMTGVLSGFLLYFVINLIFFSQKTSLIFSVITCSLSILFMLLIRFSYGIYRMKFTRINKEFKVDDLLERDCVSFDKKEIDKFLHQKVIMVTGGGGSIGSELCRQIASSNPAQLIIIDYYENNAYDIQQELLYEYKDGLNLAVEIASVQDRDKMNQLFQRYKPQIVFHAAAHKHVPFMEQCPEEAIKNNIFGTYNVVQAANQWNVEKFVLISTDKAVNPTSMMGASKRMCEMIIQSMKNISNSKYAAVRFGNVLGSSGSVIPLFKRQIEHGGPITITDKRVERYFMTVSEAVQLVLTAGTMASHSEIYVLDMGKPVNILKLAENLIRLLGYVPYSEIPIIEVGMRPGEKINEELFMQEELVMTENKKIFIEKQKSMSPEEIEEKMEILRKALETKDGSIIRQSLMKIVPSFMINNNVTD